MSKNKKILILLAIILVIIAGIILLCVKGMNYGLIYGENTTIEIYLETDFELSDIKIIAEETFDSKNNIRLLDQSECDILITVKTISDEELDTFVSKINEKYGLEVKKSDLIVINNAQMKLTDLINQYIYPVIITSLIILIYFIIRYRKLGISKVILYTLIAIIGLQMILLSIYSIIRIPVNELTMPISILIYILSILELANIFDNKIK